VCYAEKDGDDVGDCALSRSLLEGKEGKLPALMRQVRPALCLSATLAAARSSRASCAAQGNRAGPTCRLGRFRNVACASRLGLELGLIQNLSGNLLALQGNASRLRIYQGGPRA